MRIWDGRNGFQSSGLNGCMSKRYVAVSQCHKLMQLLPNLRKIELQEWMESLLAY